MGGQPDDNPRGLESGGGDRVRDEQGGDTGPVGGAFGSAQGDIAGGGTAQETEGVGGDNAVADTYLPSGEHAKK